MNMNFFTLHRRCLLTMLSLLFFFSVRGQFAPPQLIDLDFVSARFTLFDMDGDGDLDVFTTGNSFILKIIPMKKSGSACWTFREDWYGKKNARLRLICNWISPPWPEVCICCS